MSDTEATTDFTFWNTRRGVALPTVRVRDKETGDTFLINKVDFDAKTQTVATDAVVMPKEDAPKTKAEPKANKEPATEGPRQTK